MQEAEQLKQEICDLISETIDLESLGISRIAPDDALFGDEIDLDSIDALEIGIALQRRYQVKLSASSEENQKHFYSIATLAKFIQDEKDT